MIAARSHLLHPFQQQVEADRQQWRRCQRGQHEMLATATPGIVVCRCCRTLGVCLWCGWSLHQRLLAAPRAGTLAGSPPAHRGGGGVAAGRHRGERL